MKSYKKKFVFLQITIFNYLICFTIYKKLQLFFVIFCDLENYNKKTMKVCVIFGL